MNQRQKLRRVAPRYAATLRKFLADEREAALEDVQKLGRATVAAGVGVVSLARVRRYAATLRKYLAQERESRLEEAYELGRSAIAAGLGVLDMARIHMEARDKVLRAELPAKRREHVAKLAGIFYLQALSPFEATHRGFRETNAELLKRNRQLAGEIASRQRVERALRESEQRYSTLVETANDVIFSVAPDGRFTALNPAFEKITGWPRSAWLGKPFAPLIHPEEARLAKERFYAVLRGRPPEVWEYRVRKADGQYLVGELTLAREVKNGKPVGIFGIGRDITERKRAEEALRRSEERFRLLIANVRDYALFLLKPDGRVASWNTGAERINGYREPEIVGRHFSCFYTAPDAKLGKPARELGLALRTGRHEAENWRVRKDGSRYWAHVVITPVRDGAGRLLGFAKVTQDVTERKRAEEALRRSEAHYRELFAEAKRLQEDLRRLSNKVVRAQEEERKRISRELHDEVGQSLTAISVTLATLKSNGAPPKNFGRTAARIQRLLQETMDSVHRFARELRPAMLDELGLLPALRSHIQRFSERTGLRVRLHADASVETLNSEQKTALFRIAQECLTNVAKHACASRAQVSVQRSGDTVGLTVADNGRSFQDNPVSAAKSRQRLGLLGMQERVKLISGEFAIHARPGKGTTVRVTIPARLRNPGGTRGSDRLRPERLPPMPVMEGVDNHGKNTSSTSR